jgi:hypothetical protein
LLTIHVTPCQEEEFRGSAKGSPLLSLPQIEILGAAMFKESRSEGGRHDQDIGLSLGWHDG